MNQLQQTKFRKCSYGEVYAKDVYERLRVLFKINLPKIFHRVFENEIP